MVTKPPILSRIFSQLTELIKSMPTRHNSPIYDECQTQSAWVLTLSRKRAHPDDQNDTPQPICEFQVGFPLLWIRINQDNP